MWLALLAAIVATAGNNIGKALQKKGVDGLPPMSFDKDVLKAYATCKVWLLGVSGDILGAVFTAIALMMASVSAIQPILAAGTVFLVLFSHFYLKERLRAKEWIGVVLAIVGAIGMSATLLKGKDRLLFPEAWIALGSVVFIIALCEWMIRTHRWVELSSGLQMGISFGFSAVWMRAGMLLAQEHGMPLFGIAGVVGSVFWSSLGFYFQTRGLQLGRALVIGTYSTIFGLIVAVLIGLLALNEPFPPTSSGIILRVGSMVLIVVGASMMVGSKEQEGGFKEGEDNR